MANPFASNIALSHRFGVYFLESGFIPTGLDFRFQRVSGMQAEIEMENIYEGGVLSPHRVPKRVKYQNLVLQRGLVTSFSPLSINVSLALSNLGLNPSTVLVILFDENGGHVMHKIFTRTVPVKWSLSEMDADSNQVMVERIELTYTKFTSVPILLDLFTPPKIMI